EEFDGESLNDGLWVTSKRYSAAWNRFIVDDSRVAFVDNGHLVFRCFANPGDVDGFEGQMISGAKQTSGNFAFNHGYIEARILTVPHSGNFPAFWLMPEDQTGGWPTCGEIDIWETINTESRAYHTVHTHWTYDLAHGGNGGNEACQHEAQWHTYGLLKEADRMTWYLDGTQVFTYSKSTSETELQQGQWPFDKPFYIILNQSVGTGSWAAAPDPSFVYETRFDWVRVYQTRREAEDDGNVLLGAETDHNYVSTQPTETDTTIYDLSGRKVTSPRRGSFYIYKGRVRMWR
ncbi:MAG: glycoside hydrolase family 16 protein, partial [Bacteroidaceae bacterium]